MRIDVSQETIDVSGVIGRKRNDVGLYATLLAGAAIVLYLTYDILLTNIFGLYYCKIAPPHPKTKIEKKVEYPISIYWEDNVYPGFSKQDRELMIKNYLDGVHLKTMALNGDDGKIYVYNRKVSKKEYLNISNQISSLSKKIKRMQEIQKDRQDKQYIRDINKLYRDRETLQAKQTKLINSSPISEKIYTKSTMPKTNYTVTFNEIHLNTFARKFLYSDETKVIENSTNKVIAYNRRYMRFFYTLQPDFVGDRYYYPHAVCGENSQYFFLKVFQKIKINSGFIAESFNSKLYRKYIKGER